MVHTRAWRNGAAAERDFPLDRVSDLVAEDGVFVWVDFTDVTAADLEHLEAELGLHVLAVEDATEAGQRPKLDRYRDSLFLVAYDVTAPEQGSEVETEEVKAFITRDALVTMHGPGFRTDRVEQRWEDDADLAEHGVPWLTWGLLDVLADDALATAATLSDRVDHLEDVLFTSSGRGHHIQRRSFALRKALGTLRRLTVPMKDVIASMLRDDERHDVARFPDGLAPYFRDVADHLANVSETVDEQRDTVSSVLETNLSLASNRQNLVMKKVTSWAAIIAIPTAITGFFGQNVTLPWGGTWWGLVLSSAVIAVTSVVLYNAFKRRDWL